MGNNDNYKWAARIIRKFDKLFKHRWEAFNELLTESLDSEKVWIDCGCGDNSLIKSYGSIAKYAVGVDLMPNTKNDSEYIIADLRKLPFPDDFADVITLRFVVEHLPEIELDFKDILRVLKSNGKLIILTTNSWSPLVAIGKLLPYSLKESLISKIFKVQSEDIFPTYHRFNSPKQIKKAFQGLKLSSVYYISDLNYTRKIIFFVLLFFHIITLLPSMSFFRTNILAEYIRE